VEWIFFLKKYPWSDLTNKNTPTPELIIKDDFFFFVNNYSKGIPKKKLISLAFDGKRSIEVLFH
jgi:hypothetical protein